VKIIDEKIISFLKEYWKQLLISIIVLITMRILSTFFEMGLEYHLLITIPYLLFVFIFISIYVKFQKHQAFVLKGIRYYRKDLFSVVEQHLRTKSGMVCLSCGRENVSVKGITRFNICTIETPQKGGANLISAVIGCDDCGFIQQYNLPLSLFADDKSKK